MIPRVLEPEAMDSFQEAIDYDRMDHREVNRIFVADLIAAGFKAGWVLDLGSGTAQIPIELCRQCPSVEVVAIDAAFAMLQVARENVNAAHLSQRILIVRADAKRLPFRDESFPTVISNSLIHHIPEPAAVLSEAWRVVQPGGLLFFRDLIRPNEEAIVQRLVEQYAPGANEHQQQMFAASFRASLTLEEMKDLAENLGLSRKLVEATSDRHWTLVARKSV